MLLVACIWGFAFVAQVEGTAHVQPFTLTGIRFLIGIIALLPVVLFFERGRVNFRANGAEVASFYDGLGNEKDPYSGLNPVMHHKGCTNGTITFRIDIAGAKM